jgi:hypothetical protein
MPDITMCSGTGCELKDTCYRHTAKPSDYQSWFLVVPYDPGVDDECEYYWSIDESR